MKMKKSNPFPYGKFCFADFCGDQAKLDENRTETGQHPDRKKCPKTGQPDKAFGHRKERALRKNERETFFRRRYIEWRVWKRRGVEPMERKPDIDDLIFGDERPISQR